MVRRTRPFKSMHQFSYLFPLLQVFPVSAHAGLPSAPLSPPASLRPRGFFWRIPTLPLYGNNFLEKSSFIFCFPENASDSPVWGLYHWVPCYSNQSWFNFTINFKYLYEFWELYIMYFEHTHSPPDSSHNHALPHFPILNATSSFETSFFFLFTLPPVCYQATLENGACPGVGLTYHKSHH